MLVPCTWALAAADRNTIRAAPGVDQIDLYGSISVNVLK
jgi:hypothetical protein